MRLYWIEMDTVLHLAIAIDDGAFSICVVLFGQGLEIESENYGEHFTVDLPS